jgi:SAM-dependent methyltransferase
VEDRTEDHDGEVWRRTNMAWWDERAPAHAAADSTYDLDRLVAGHDDLRPFEDDELGVVDGLDLLHLQCHIGTDTVCWARRGARVTGLDFSATALAAAATLAERCGVSLELVRADVHDAVAALDGRSFDVVYTGVGALNWLPDLPRWARTVCDLLRPGGVLYLVELHPMWMALGDDGRTIREDAITGAYRCWDEPQDGSYGAPGVTFEHQATWERLHPLGDVLSAVLGAGLTIELYHEWPFTPAPTPWLVAGDDGLHRFPDGMEPFPLLYSLRAGRSP